MVIAIITARKGSKRIRNKNIRLIKKKPIYYWSIRNLKRSGIFKKIIISTDHLKIIRNGKKYGADIMLKRTPELSKNNVKTIDVVKDAIKDLIKKGLRFNYICCMYPTSPLTDPKDIKRSLKILKKNQSKFIFPVYQNKNYKNSNQFNIYQKIKSVNYRRKLLINKYFYDAGQFYFSTKKNWLSKKDIIDKNNLILIKKNTELRDINTQSDLNFVRKIFRNKK
tara:strand:+ start:315 stop:983 length:669 start_codon:yes stop_codon:yes gene_type:complete